MNVCAVVKGVGSHGNRGAVSDHPFYGSVALFLTGSSLAAASWFFLVLGCVVLSLIALRTRTEEEKLLDRFGDAYRTYRKRTGRFFPRV